MGRCLVGITWKEEPGTVAPLPATNEEEAEVGGGCVGCAVQMVWGGVRSTTEEEAEVGVAVAACSMDPHRIACFHGRMFAVPAAEGSAEL